MTLVRLKPALQQELTSRHQLAERLVAFGWTLDPVSTDLGEDFVVHIYVQGRHTGVNFYVQEKSITNLEDRHKNGYLVYEGIEVQDLLRWERMTLPVALVVWDT